MLEGAIWAICTRWAGGQLAVVGLPSIIKAPIWETCLMNALQSLMSGCHNKEEVRC